MLGARCATEKTLSRVAWSTGSGKKARRERRLVTMSSNILAWSDMGLVSLKLGRAIMRTAGQKQKIALR